METDDTRGRKEIFADNKKLAKLLIEIDSGRKLTNYMQHRLEDAEYLIVRDDTSSSSRGRPRKIVTLSGKARTLIALSKGWVKKANVA